MMSYYYIMDKNIQKMVKKKMTGKITLEINYEQLQMIDSALQQDLCNLINDGGEPSEKFESFVNKIHEFRRSTLIYKRDLQTRIF